ncbi:hypothetical protein GF323_07030 [Candidatus Woesearchaeota archaeon]|nr:hypothetical protein [Candidatus Woesearchaeota archaeon]
MKSQIFESRKKSQSGMNAAVLVAILAALIIIYIIFLPSNERLELVDNESDFGGSGEDEDDILLEDKEIIMQVIGQDEIEHDFPSVNLYTSTEAEKLREENSVYVKNGLFDEQSKQIDFKVKDPDNTKNILLSFEAKKRKGRLIIVLNDYEIYNNKVEKVNVDPIKISNDYIGEDNQLSLSVSGVGAAFWSTNEYLLENFKITADITDTSTREAEIKFVLSEGEAGNIEKSELRFVPDCQPANVGLLTILINRNEIYSSVPDCGIARPLEFAPMYLLRGENKLTFSTERGRYLIDQIKITNDLEEQPSYTYFFELENDELEDIEDEQKKVNLTFYFVDDKEDKEAEIVINGMRSLSMRFHDAAVWSRIIPADFLEAGSNSLKIIPEERMEVRKLQLTLEDD